MQVIGKTDQKAPSKARHIGGIVGGMLLNFLMPPRCFVTGEAVAEQGALSPELWRALRFVTGTQCQQCGVSMPESYAEDMICGACHAYPPPYHRARAILHYDDASKRMILGFKHGDKTHMAKPLAAWMARVGAELIHDCDVIIPVPLHPFRLFRRRYNQAALLAQNIARQTGKPLDLKTLQRTRHTKVQGHLSGKDRHKNIKGAFALLENNTDKIKGKKILLIDDVYTSGATVKECARVLLLGGAVQVDILTLAKVM